MDIGKIGVLAGLVASALAIILYALALRGNRKTLWAARAAYSVAAASAVFCFGRLMWLCVQHQFQYKYVFEYVSNDLGFPFVYAATWAGQEGSFLLWAFWTAVIGGLVAWKAGKWEARVMPFYISSLAILFAILAWLSPYHLIPRGTGPNDYPLALPWPPQDGQGLNPSLQNYWMAIHPPTIFFGFVSLSIPFCFALASMIWREYASWAPRVMPWVLMAVATLGIGLFMGGYWAYETQGWHGFWAWDPVENASLFPWLASLGLLHGLVVQKSRGGMGRTNIFLAIIAWLLFLYGTFLTRSGVLVNFSVHAFGMLANSALSLLWVMIALHGLTGLVLLALRWKSIPGRPISDKLLSRDTAMVLAVTIMIAASIVVLIGTSWPLISQWTLLKQIPFLSSFYAEKGVRVEPPFYNKVGSWLLIPALILMGIVPFLAWGKTNLDKFLTRLLAPWFLALAGGTLIVWFVLHELSIGFKADTPRMLVVAIGTLGLFVAISNLMLAVKLLRVKAVTMGGWLAHVGIGLLFLGTVLTNVYEKTEPYVLIEGAPPVKTPFGYSLQFAGWTHDGKSPEEIREDWWKFEHGVKIRVTRLLSGKGAARADDTGPAEADPHHGLSLPEGHPPIDMLGILQQKEGKSFIAVAPVFYHRQLVLNRQEDGPVTMRWPYIHKELHRDFYIAIANDPKLLRASATLRPGETASIGVTGLFTTDYAVHYKKFFMDGAPGQPGTKMGAEMELVTPDGRKIPIRPAMLLGGEQGPASVNTAIPEVNGAVILEGGVNASTKEVTVAFELPDAPAIWAIPVAVTNKPAINLVWLGVILMGLGTFCAMMRRALEARKGVVFQAAAAQGVMDAESAAVPAQPTEQSHPARVVSRRRRPARAKSGS